MKSFTNSFLSLLLVTSLFLPKNLVVPKTKKAPTKMAMESVAYKKPGYKPGEVLIGFKPSTSKEQQQTISNAAGESKVLRTIDLKGRQRINLVKLRKEVSVKTALRKLKAERLIKFASPNYIRKTNFTPNDSYFSEQWGLNNTGQENYYGDLGTPDADIDAPESWDIEKGYTNQVASAVIDSGIDSDHPDLSSKIVSGYNWAGISQYYANTAWYFGKSNTSERAQSIKGTGQPLSHIGLLIKKVGSPSADIVVSVRDSLSGPDLRSLTISTSEVTTDYAEVYRALDAPLTLIEGQTYYVVFKATIANENNYYLIAGNSDLQDYYYGDIYAEGGQFWSDGSSWQNYSYYDWYFRTNENASPHDDNGHGTHVSGILGASSDNSIGVAGVSHGAKILPLKVTDSSGQTTSADLISAIAYAADNGAKVINISLGGQESSALEQDAVNYAYGKGVTIFAAAGNSAWYGNPVEYPAAYDHVVSVGATTNADSWADFSNYNSYVDISAPGEGIISTFPTYTVALSDWGYFGDYDYMDGTSMAAPMVAGVGSLLLSRNPDLSPDQVKQIIEDNSDDKGTIGKDIYFGYGRVNAYKAVKAIYNPNEPEVINVTSDTSNGGYVTGDVIDIKVEFSEPVNSIGTPKITLETGNIDREAVYQSGSGTATLTFNYVVEEGDSSPDLACRDDVITLSEGESIKDNDDNDADLNLPESGKPGSLNYNKDIIIGDFTAPSTQIIAGPVDGSTVNTSSVSFYFMGDDFGGSGNLTYSHRLAGETDWANYSTENKANYSNLSEGEHTFEVKAKDAAGNEDLTPASRQFTYSSKEPLVDDSTFISAPSRIDMVYDDNREILYITNGGSVLRYDLNSSSFLSPFVLGGNLMGIDLSPDGNTLAVADRSYAGSEVWVYLINLPSEHIEKITFPRDFYEGGTFTVAFGYDYSLLISSTFLGSGWVPLRKYNLFTGQKSILASVCQSTMLCASADGSSIGFAESDSSDGPFGRYRVTDGNLLRKEGYEDGTAAFNYEIGVNRDATQYAIPTYKGTFITNGGLTKYAKVGSQYPGGQPIGVVYSPTKKVVYFAWATTDKVYAYNSGTLNKIGDYNFKNTFDISGNYAFIEGRLKISRDGKLLFGTVENGIRCLNLSSDDPMISSSSHTPNVYSNDNTIDIEWSGAIDEDGIDGYTFDWSQDPNHQPDEMKDVEENINNTTSAPLADGSWYFILRTRDNAGNWSNAVSYGPFKIDKTAPEMQVGALSESKYYKSKILLSASSQDSQSGLDKMHFYHGNTLLYTSVTSPASFLWDSSKYNGSQIIKISATDKVGNQSTFSQTIKIDNYKPKTYTTKKVTIRKGNTARLYWKAYDPYTGSRARVTLKLQKRYGRSYRTVKNISYGLTAINTTRFYRQRFNRRGTYRFLVYAKDQAGNNQYNIARNYVIVR